MIAYFCYFLCHSTFRVNVQVDPTCRYDNVPFVVKFNKSYRLVGGLNLPKIISYVGSDGISRRQLVKVGQWMCFPFFFLFFFFCLWLVLAWNLFAKTTAWAFLAIFKGSVE